MSKFDSFINNFLKEEEISRKDRLKSLKSLAETLYSITSNGQNIGLNYLTRDKVVKSFEEYARHSTGEHFLAIKQDEHMKYPRHEFFSDAYKVPVIDLVDYMIRTENEVFVSDRSGHFVNFGITRVN